MFLSIHQYSFLRTINQFIHSSFRFHSLFFPSYCFSLFPTFSSFCHSWYVWLILRTGGQFTPILMCCSLFATLSFLFARHFILLKSHIIYGLLQKKMFWEHSQMEAAPAPGFQFNTSPSAHPSDLFREGVIFEGCGSRGSGRYSPTYMTKAPVLPVRAAKRRR